MRYLHFRFYRVIYTVFAMLVVKLKSWTTQDDVRLTGRFANSFGTRFSFFLKHHSGLKLECQANFKFQSWMMLKQDTIIT